MKTISLLTPIRVLVGLLLTAHCLLFTTSCNLPQPQADTARYFTLSDPPVEAARPDATTVRPVKLAGHLRNRALAVRVAANEVVYNEDLRWAEPLADAITQSLRVRLGQVGGGNTVSVQVQRCELVRFEGNAVRLEAAYSIMPAEGGKAIPGVFTSSPRTWNGKDYGTLVGLLHEAVGELGDAIASALAENK